MKRTMSLACLLVFALMLNAQASPGGWSSPVKDKTPTSRTLTGRVLNGSGAPIVNAVVHLTNTRTMVVKTYIVASDGSYRFPALSPNIDYEVYAQVGDQKSDTKTLSSFDGRPDPVINLHFNVR
jgi:hypothetical protein